MNQGQDTIAPKAAPNDAQAIFAQAAFLPDGWQQNVLIRIAEGRIVAVTPQSTKPQDAANTAILLPGITNLHSHAFQRGMAGLTEQRSCGSDSFWTWRDWMYRFVKQIAPDDARVLAELAYMEMLESGITRVGEFHYLHHDMSGQAYADPAEMGAQIFEAGRSAGINTTLLAVYYNRSDFDATGCSPMQARFGSTLEGYTDLLASARAHAHTYSGSTVGCAVHSLRAAHTDDIRAVARLAESCNVHIHIAEQMREVEACLAHHGARPVQYLLGELDINERWCLVHATHMTQDERQAVARTRAVIGLCPITEANLGDGILDVDNFQKEGGTWGIGSDSNVRIDAAEELRLLEYGQRLVQKARNVLAPGVYKSTGRVLFERAVTGGAQALGSGCGLAVGQWADMFSLAPDHPSLVGRTGDHVLDSFVFACGQSAIDSVWVRGRRQVSHGRHIQRHAIVARYTDVVKRMTTR